MKRIIFNLLLHLAVFTFCLYLCSCKLPAANIVSIPTIKEGSKNCSHSLERFHKAQTTEQLTSVEKELITGRKTSHWIWYIFPQLEGLGSSPSSRYYGIESLDEARKYLRDDVLRDRLTRHTCLVLKHKSSKTLEEIFGKVDAKKFISSMTLFNIADPSERTFAQALEGRTHCKKTMEIVKTMKSI